jgi:hypothetical protein
MKETLAKLLRVRPYINDERFKKICEERQIPDRRKLWEDFNRSFMYFLTLAPDELVDGFLELDSKIQNENFLSTVFKERDSYKKIVFENKKTIEINIATVEGLENLLKFYKNESIEHVLPMVDTIDNSKNDSKKYINLFEGDIIKCYDEWHNQKSPVFLACLDTQFINPDPYYVELLYTEKYGYLNGKNQPNKDNQAIKFDQSLFHMKEGRMNYHCITLTKSWEVIGNIFVDYNVLKPL